MGRLTDDSVSRLSLGDKAERYVRDSVDKGFAVRLRRRADGSIQRTFLVKRQIPGDGARKRRKVFLGDFPTFGTGAARDEARRMLQAAKRGEDPKAERKGNLSAPTFAEYADSFMQSEDFQSLKAATRQDYKNRLGRSLKPAFGDVKVRNIDRQSIVAWHRKGRAKLYDANRSLSLLSKMMASAVRDGVRDDNPCSGVSKHKETARDRWLDETDLPAFLATLGKEEGPHADCIRFLTVTGWRVSEALGLRWDMVDLPRLTAKLPDTKTGAQTRALAADAAALVDRQAHRIGFVFSSRKGSYPIGYKQLRETLSTICAKAGIEPLRPHDLRHTAATWAAIHGAGAHELREAFGWKTLQMTERYVSRAEALGRKGADKAAAAINIFGKPVADVVKAK